MKKMFMICVTALLLTLGMVGNGNASLFDDFISIQHDFAEFGTLWHTNAGPFEVQVVSGNSDLVHIGSWVEHYTVNVEPTTIYVDFTLPWGAVWIDSSFNGLVIRDIDPININEIDYLSIETNMSGWTNTHAIIGNDYLAFNWHGLSFNQNSYFNVDIVPVPVPGAALLGMIGLSVAGIKLRKHA